MNCKKCNTLLFECLEGALSNRQRTAMDAHLAHCEACRVKLEAEKARSVELKRMLDETTAGVSVNPFVSGRIRSILNSDSKEFTVKGYIMKMLRKHLFGSIALLTTICFALVIWEVKKHSPK